MLQFSVVLNKVMIHRIPIQMTKEPSANQQTVTTEDFLIHRNHQRTAATHHKQSYCCNEKSLSVCKTPDISTLRPPSQNTHYDTPSHTATDVQRYILHSNTHGLAAHELKHCNLNSPTKQISPPLDVVCFLSQARLLLRKQQWMNGHTHTHVHTHTFPHIHAPILKAAAQQNPTRE